MSGVLDGCASGTRVAYGLAGDGATQCIGRLQRYQEMLQQVLIRLPKGVQVVLLADQGFVHTDLMKAMTTQWGWHYRIRLKKDTWIWRQGKGWCQLKDFHFK